MAYSKSGGLASLNQEDLLADTPLNDLVPAKKSRATSATINRFRIDLRQLAAAYLAAKAFVLNAGFEAEIDYQEDCSLARMGESDFLREGAWVILSSGMRESVIRVKFEEVSAAFGYWRCASWITRRIAKCRRNALAAFAHAGKIEAIIELARRVNELGIDEVIYQVGAQGIAYLQTFPFMGPATAYHFAKNLGLDVVKPDRHLTRVSKVAGFDSPWDLCDAIGEVTGEKRSVVDLVIWRYATIHRDYLATFAVPRQCIYCGDLLAPHSDCPCAGPIRVEDTL